LIKIGLISDTHGWLDEMVLQHFENCDEIWHGGDFGSRQVIDQLKALKPLRGVYGNIDDPEIRRQFPEKSFFTCEGMNVFMQHIGGYPGRYAPGVKKDINSKKANIFISGHSHILKIMYDPAVECMHLNPGAAGRQGWHTVRTIIRFSIDGKELKDCEVIELGKR
jgi:uncharacterized protein